MRVSTWQATALVAIAVVFVALLPTPFAAAATTVTFRDSHLEAAVRSVLGKPTGDITDTDMSTITTLTANGQAIGGVEGLQYATSLSKLDLGNNQIGYIGQLAGLSSLTELHLQYNQLRDITPLEDLSNLHSLWIVGNHLKLTPLTAPNWSVVTTLQAGGTDVLYLNQFTALEKGFTSRAIVVRHHGVAYFDWRGAYLHNGYAARLSNRRVFLDARHGANRADQGTPWAPMRGSIMYTDAQGGMSIRVAFTHAGWWDMRWSTPRPWDEPYFASSTPPTRVWVQ